MSLSWSRAAGLGGAELKMNGGEAPRIPRLHRSAGAAALVVGLGIGIGVGTALSPILTVALAAAAGIAFIAGISGPRFYRVFLPCLGTLLIGYAFLGRGFAYLGYRPVFVGEVVLTLGVIAAGLSPKHLTSGRSLTVWLIYGFAAWGALRTIPYLGTYGVDALRDAVIWGYAAFALIVAAVLPRSDWLWASVHRYRALVPAFVLWAPVTRVLAPWLGDLAPRLPGSPVAIIQLKPGDTAVHLAGALAFLALGLGYLRPEPKPRHRFHEWGLWVAWLAGFAVVGSANRGGLLAMLVVMVLVLFLRPAFWFRLATVSLILVGLSIALDVQLHLAGSRAVSPSQIVANLQSVVSPSSSLDPDLIGTREWRLAWWSRIVGYTVFGDYFWQGKGFGINLADDDGFQVSPDHSLRSPHNSHLTILARTGVPGLALWVLLQCSFAIELGTAYLRARRLHRDHWAQLDLFILAYWAAFLVNGLFDVFLEGPQGGIWFWSLVGFGIATLDAQGTLKTVSDQFAPPRSVYVRAESQEARSE